LFVKAIIGQCDALARSSAWAAAGNGFVSRIWYTWFTSIECQRVVVGTTIVIAHLSELPHASKFHKSQRARQTLVPSAELS
jgi:hypothetical protein